jgi:hypothetical protein
MKIKELVKKLNKEIKKVDFSKVHTHDEFHKLIKNSIYSLLTGNLRLGIWDIQNGDDYNDKVVEYNRNFIQYKNSKHQSKGNFSNVNFTAIKEVSNLETKDLDSFFKEKHRQEEIANLKKYIIDHQKEITDAEKRLAKLQ